MNSSHNFGSGRTRENNIDFIKVDIYISFRPSASHPANKVDLSLKWIVETRQFHPCGSNVGGR